MLSLEEYERYIAKLEAELSHAQPKWRRRWIKSTLIFARSWRDRLRMSQGEADEPIIVEMPPKSTTADPAGPTKLIS